jgi:AraC family transcriptional regulator
MHTIPSDEVIAKKFRLEQAPTLLARQNAAAPIAFSRLRGEGAFRGRTLAAPPEDAFAFHVILAPMQAGEIWIDGKHGALPAASPGDTLVFDLSADATASLTPPYDIMRFYLPVATLDDLTGEQGSRRIGRLRTTSRGVQDPVMRGLAWSVLGAVQEQSAAPMLFVEQIAEAFYTHAARAYGDNSDSGKSLGTGLAPWQMRRAQSFIEAHLDGDPSVADLAGECRLSASHFGRAFRLSVGMPPHQWLTHRRIERAKDLLREGDMRLAEIALACGFGDQSHFTRTFTRLEGQGPGKWRRLRIN